MGGLGGRKGKGNDGITLNLKKKRIFFKKFKKKHKTITQKRKGFEYQI